MSKSEKSVNYSSTSTEGEKLIELSNKFQDKLLKGITDLSVTQYHSNEYYKPYTFQAQSELENRKRKERRTENNEAESTVLKEQDWCSKRQKSNDTRSNESITTLCLKVRYIWCKFKNLLMKCFTTVPRFLSSPG